GRVDELISPYQEIKQDSCATSDEPDAPKPITIHKTGRIVMPPRERTVVRLPAYETVKSDPVLYAHANRVLHLETNPGNARALVQRHGERDLWINPPPIPLSTPEMDHVFDLPYARAPHPSYADENGSHDHATKIPAWEMIRFSVNIMRGCFGGCTFCSITEHEGRIIQSRSEDSVIKEIEDIRDKVKGFTGTISDLGGPTANMYRLGCRSPEIEAACRKPSCVYPGICQNLTTDHGPLIKMYRRGRALKGIKKILIGSGLRYDLAVKSPEYIKELVQHHVGGYLKIAPEHTESGPLSKMMKPGIGSYDKFKTLFDKYSAEVGKKQFLIPYFIAAHPGTTDEDMMNLAVWLKKNGFRADQVQTFYPSPMATATAMYHSGRNTLRKIHRAAESEDETVDVVRGEKRRRLHKAFLRYHDPNNWPLLREALKAMGRADLIGNGKHHLIPTFQPLGDGGYQSARKKNSTPSGKATVKPAAPLKGRMLTQHTGLPPRVTGSKPAVARKAKPGAGR
ncbi:MAG: YgiQ family radical SAM protein, partial [Rhodoferax sp.]